MTTMNCVPAFPYFTSLHWRNYTYKSKARMNAAQWKIYYITFLWCLILTSVFDDGWLYICMCMCMCVCIIWRRKTNSFCFYLSRALFLSRSFHFILSFACRFILMWAVMVIIILWCCDHCVLNIRNVTFWHKNVIERMAWAWVLFIEWVSMSATHSNSK